MSTKALRANRRSISISRECYIRLASCVFLLAHEQIPRYSIIYPQKINYYEVGDGVNVDSVGTFNIFLDALDGIILYLAKSIIR